MTNPRVRDESGLVVLDLALYAVIIVTALLMVFVSPLVGAAFFALAWTLGALSLHFLGRGAVTETTEV